MADSHYLAAFTPHKEDPEDNSEYIFYPPFINFTQIGKRVKTIVRSRDEIVEGKDYPSTLSCAQMEMAVKEFKALLEKALENLVVDD